MASYTLDHLLEGFVDSTFPVPKDIPLTGLALNSIQLEEGYCFFAYKGASQDGRQFIPHALQQGAKAIVYDPDNYTLPPEILTDAVPFIPIPHLVKKIGGIAARFYNYPTKGIPVIGVTGTNGKTTIVHSMAQCLNALGCKVAIFGTLGNGFLENLTPSPLTTLDPITLQKQCRLYRDQGVQGFLMEVSSHGLHQGRVEGVTFSHGVFSNLSRDHLDYHGTMEAYGEAKKQLFLKEGLQYAILNGDDPFTKKILKSLPESVKPFLFTLNEKEEAYPTVKGNKMEKNISETSSTALSVTSPWGSGTFTPPLLGDFNGSNILAVITVLGTLAYDWPSILKAVEAIKPIEGRMERYTMNNGATVVVDFAHTPDALWQVLWTLKSHCKGKLWLVFGCGGERDRGKRCEMGGVAQRWCDRIVITNDNPRGEDPEAIARDILQGIVTGETPTEVILERSKAIKKTMAKAAPEDWIVVAGKGHESYQWVGDERIFFKDQHVVQEYINELIAKEG